MNKEISVLRYINSDGNTTQRDIAKKTGMSLGQVNILLKRLANKGIIKLQATSTRMIKYNLTALGKKEKAEAIYTYISDSIKIAKGMEKLVDTVLKNKIILKYKSVLLTDVQDDIHSIVLNALDENKVSFILIQEIDEILEYKNVDDCIALAWDPNSIEYFIEKDIRYINILDFIDRQDNT